MFTAQKLLHLAVLATVSAGVASSLRAADRTWIGGNVDWLDNSGTANWTGSDEPDTDDVAIFNTNNTVNLGSANSILGLTLLNGIDLGLAGFDLTVNGTVLLSSTSGTSTLTIPINSLLAADSIVGTSSSLITLSGGTINIIEESGEGVLQINDGARLTGNGIINLQDLPPSAGTTLLEVIGGTLTAASTAALDTFSNAAGTLTINLSSANGRVDLDQVGGVVVINRNDTLIINGQSHDSSDPFSSILTLNEGARIQMSEGWFFNGTMNVNTAGILIGSAGSSAVISGGAFTQSGGLIDLDFVDTLTFESVFSMTGGSIVNAGHLIFDANATIGAGANITMTSSVSSMTLGSGVQVVVNQGNFNVDGLGFESTNVLTINSGAQLTLNLTSGDDFLDSRIVLRGGRLHVNTTDNTWALGGVISVPADTGTSVISGDTVSLEGLLGDFPQVTVGANSTLRVDAVSSFGGSSSITVAAGGVMDFDGNVTLNGGTLSGLGQLRLEQSVIAGDTTVNTGSFDWDGDTIVVTHTINAGATFTINSSVFDTMNDRVTIHGSGGSLVVNGPANWTLAANLSTNPLGVGSASIGGTSRMRFSGSTWTALGNTTVSAPLTLLGSTVTIGPAATLSFNGDTIYQGNLITGTGTLNPSSVKNTVAADTTIDVTNLNFDRGDWEVQSLQLLTVNVTDYDSDAATDSFENVITLNSGRVFFTSGDAFFVMNGTLNMNNTTNNLPVWQGEGMHIGGDTGGNNAQLNIGGTGTSQILSHVTFNSDANLQIANTATLHLDGGATFNSVNNTDNTQVALYTGTGTIAFADTTTFAEATTLNMAGGTVDLDGTFGVGFDVRVWAPTVINAQTMQSFGKITAVGFNRIVVDNLNGTRTGSLTVNLDNAASEWTLNAPGFLALLNGTGAATLLAGSDINLNGMVNVEGDVRSTARLDIGGTIAIGTAAEPFRLGGGSLADPNRLQGGVIAGVGLLGADSARALRGFGTIQTDIDFDGSSELTADNGTLTLTGAIIDAGVLGTSDNDGVLEVVNAWNSSPVTNVNLQGGSLTGGLITVDNTNGISGWGTVAARVTNNTRLHANVAGNTLLFQTALNNNDWDGAANAGLLGASGGGILDLRDNAAFSFLGTASIGTGGGTITTNFPLNFGAASALNFLAGGLYHSSVSTDFGGAINVAGASRIRINTNFFLEILPTAVVTLNDNLILDSNNAIIRAGATFSGTGSLIVPTGGHLIADPNAVINVLLDNRGGFRPSGFNTVGRVDLRDYQQAPSGTIFHEFTGPNLGDFDRLIITGAAQIAGAIELDIDGGFVPVAGQTFNIINTTAGVSGMFSLVTQVDVPANVFLDVVYLPNIVQVRVANQKTWDDSAGTQAWSTGLNWSDNVEPTAADAVLFPGGLPAASRTISLTNVETGLAMNFDTNYTLNNGTLTLSGIGHPVRVLGVGTEVVINSRLNVAGPLIVYGLGTLTVNPSVLSTPGVQIQESTTLRLSGTDSALTQPVQIQGNPGFWSGRLDIAQSSLIVDTANPGDKAAKLALLMDQINSGRAGGAWTGPGITSSTVPGDPNTTLALADNADLNLTSFRGVMVDASDLIVVQARFGDATLDRVVDAFDLNILAAHWQQPANALWSDGDFTGDGVVDAFDLNLMAANWQFGAGGGLGASLSFADAVAALNLPGVAAVPEPASLLCLAGAVPLLAVRRRRRTA